MNQDEFEQRRMSGLKALSTFKEKRTIKASKKPMIKNIDLVEILLNENPSLSMILQVGIQRYAIGHICIDDENEEIVLGTLDLSD